MPVCKLDAAFVQRAHCPAGRKKIEYRCTQVVGFSLEVRASNGKTYYLRYFDQGGRQRQLKIGGVSDLTFDAARKAARRLRSEVVLGGDPLAKKKEQKGIITYAELAAQHVAHAKTYQKSWWSTDGIIRKHVLPRWAKLRLNEIKTHDVAKWLGEKAAEGLKPATVEKIRVVFGRSFELAKQWEMPGSEINPVRGIARPRYDNARQRYLSSEEARRLKDACALSPNPQLKYIVGLLLLTGARKSELLNAEWQHVDVERRVWFIPQAKSGRGRHVPLPDAALAIIKALPKPDGCPYLLPNLETGQPFVSIKHAYQTARKAAGLPDVRIHDLRHSCASAMVNSGVSIYTVSRILGHSSHGTTSARYSHLAGDTLLAAVEAGATKLSVDWTEAS